MSVYVYLFVLAVACTIGEGVLLCEFFCCHLLCVYHTSCGTHNHPFTVPVDGVCEGECDGETGDEGVW